MLWNKTQSKHRKCPAVFTQVSVGHCVLLYSDPLWSCVLLQLREKVPGARGPVGLGQGMGVCQPASLQDGKGQRWAGWGEVRVHPWQEQSWVSEGPSLPSQEQRRVGEGLEQVAAWSRLTGADWACGHPQGAGGLRAGWKSADKSWLSCSEEMKWGPTVWCPHELGGPGLPGAGLCCGRALPGLWMGAGAVPGFPLTCDVNRNIKQTYLWQCN